MAAGAEKSQEKLRQGEMEGISVFPPQQLFRRHDPICRHAYQDLRVLPRRWIKCRGCSGPTGFERLRFAGRHEPKQEVGSVRQFVELEAVIGVAGKNRDLILTWSIGESIDPRWQSCNGKPLFFRLQRPHLMAGAQCFRG